VVGWSRGATYELARVTPDGAFLEGPTDVSATAQWGERDDPFRDHHNGDIVWSWFDSPGATSFKLARIRAGGVCTPP
jgi:hypothetical protein